MGDAGEPACMTPDQCFNEMAVALGVPKDTGYIDLLDLVKKLKKETEELKHKEYCLRQDAKGYSPSEVQEYREETEELKEENKNLREGIRQLADEMRKLNEIPKLKAENKELKDTILCLRDDVPPDCCIGCDKKFDLHYTMNHADKQLREKYDKYFGSENDDGDLCPICLDSNY
jgi:FtsZ-binding cell division protein ZapB